MSTYIVTIDVTKTGNKADTNQALITKLVEASTVHEAIKQVALKVPEVDKE